MPLDGPASQVIHPRWSAHHRPTATATMTAQCTITRTSGDGTTGPDGTWTPDGPSTFYEGPCRVQALTTNERIEVAGEDQNTVRRYLVSVQYDTERVEVNDLVTVTEAVDVGLVGMGFRVVDVRYGSEQWQRDLIAEEVS
jgi:hypothetical protein